MIAYHLEKIGTMQNITSSDHTVLYRAEPHRKQKMNIY